MKFRFLTAGESHGKALIGIIEGIPANVPLVKEDITRELKRRKLGYGRGKRQKIETEEIEITAGVRHGLTLGSPIALYLPNQDYKNWEKIMSIHPQDKTSARKVNIPRPGHADYIGGVKYRQEDLRNILERASARETAMRVALGAIAKKFLHELEVEISSRVIQIGSVCDETSLDDYKNINQRTDSSPVRCLSPEKTQEMVALIDEAKKEGDSLGGIFEVYGVNLPLGLGSYIQWDHRLEGKVAQSFLSLNAIKSVEIGLGRESGTLKGSQVHDPLSYREKVSFDSNKTGGILGGMTTGLPIIVRAGMKPIATLMKALPSVDLNTRQEAPAHVERSDYCAVPAAAVIGESLLALTLSEVFLSKFGGDSLQEIQERVGDWRRETKS